MSILNGLEFKEIVQEYPVIPVEVWSKFVPKLKLVGSQFFGTAHDDSDYDYLLNMNDNELFKAFKFLEGKGYFGIHYLLYSSNNMTQGVYTTSVNGCKVHIILTSEFEELYKAFELAKATKLFNKMSKADAMIYFNAYCNWTYNSIIENRRIWEIPF